MSKKEVWENIIINMIDEDDEDYESFLVLESYILMKVYQLIKVEIVNEVIACDVSPVTMFYDIL